MRLEVEINGRIKKAIQLWFEHEDRVQREQMILEICKELRDEYLRSSRFKIYSIEFFVYMESKMNSETFTA